MIKKRIEYLDILRGFGIITMIIGHISFSNGVGLDHIIDHFIHAFHMLLFFFISGMLYSKKDKPVAKQILAKAKSLLIPYISFGLIAYALWLVIHIQEISINPLIGILLVDSNNIPISGAIWFLFALFLTYAIYISLEKLIKNYTIFTVAIFTIAILGSFQQKIVDVQLPFTITQAFVGVGIFHIGRLLNENVDKKIVNTLFNMPLWLLCVSIPVSVALIFLNKYINMRTNEYGYVLLFWFNLVHCTLNGINVCKLIDKLDKNNITKPLKTIGRDSIVFLCLNQIIISVLDKVLVRFIANTYLKGVIILVVSLCAMFVCNYIIQHTFLKIFIGKSRNK